MQDKAKKQLEEGYKDRNAYFFALQAMATAKNTTQNKQWNRIMSKYFKPHKTKGMINLKHPRILDWFPSNTKKEKQKQKGKKQSTSNQTGTANRHK